MSPIERAARALAKLGDAKWDAQHFGETPSGQEPEDMRQGYYDQARVVLQALREPSNEMTVVGWKFADTRDAILGNGEIAMLWQAMIDRALSE